MSAPAGREQRGDDPTLYARRRARRARTATSTVADAPPTAPIEGSVGMAVANLAVDAPPMAPGLSGPDIEPSPSAQRAFEGDVAIKDLRRRLSLDPDLVLEPPLRADRVRALPWIGRFGFILLSAALVAFLITIVTVPTLPRRDALVAAVTPLIDDWARGGSEPVRLVVESQRGFANEPLPLGVALSNAAGAEVLTLAGLANGTRLSAGAPLGLTGWQLPARELGKAFAYAPRDFVGVMSAAVDLRSPRDRLMDSQIVRLEWVPRKEMRPPPPKAEPVRAVVQPLAPEEVDTLIKRADDFLQIGDIAAARLALRRAASAGNAKAALALGMTYDPTVLAEQGVLGLTPDPDQARSWYQRAAELGSPEAPRRLEWLGQGVR